MTYYADTSWWIAYRCRAESKHLAAVTLFDLDPEAKLLWTPWHRVEVFNSLLQAEHSGLLKGGDGRKAVDRLAEDVRLGYFPHQEFNWTEAVQRSCDLSRRFGQVQLVRGMDLFHVAIAQTVQAEIFLTFDDAQAKFAQAAGMNVQVPTIPTQSRRG